MSHRFDPYIVRIPMTHVDPAHCPVSLWHLAFCMSMRSKAARGLFSSWRMRKYCVRNVKDGFLLYELIMVTNVRNTGSTEKNWSGLICHGWSSGLCCEALEFQRARELACRDGYVKIGCPWDGRVTLWKIGILLNAFGTFWRSSADHPRKTTRSLDNATCHICPTSMKSWISKKSTKKYRKIATNQQLSSKAKHPRQNMTFCREIGAEVERRITSTSSSEPNRPRPGKWR